MTDEERFTKLADLIERADAGEDFDALYLEALEVLGDTLGWAIEGLMLYAPDDWTPPRAKPRP